MKHQLWRRSFQLNFSPLLSGWDFQGNRPRAAKLWQKLNFNRIADEIEQDAHAG